jgi:hypothetical protein
MLQISLVREFLQCFYSKFLQYFSNKAFKGLNRCNELLQVFYIQKIRRNLIDMQYCGIQIQVRATTSFY